MLRGRYKGRAIKTGGVYYPRSSKYFDSKVAEYRARRRAGYSTVARTKGPLAVGEMKYFDSSKVATSVAASTDWTGTEYDPTTENCLFVPQQGSALNQRIGRKVKVMKIKVRGFIQCAAQVDQTAADNPAVMRLCLVMDTQTNGTQMQGENVFGELSTNTNSAVTWFQNPDNFGRFRILKDKFFTLQNPNMVYDGTNIEQAGVARPFKINITFKTPIVVNFNATNGGSVADIIDNSFHIICNTSAAALTPQIYYMCRVAYKE